MKIIWLIFITLFFIACTSESGSTIEDDKQLTVEEETLEVESVDDMLKRDKERLDSMEQVLMNKVEED